MDDLHRAQRALYRALVLKLADVVLRSAAAGNIAGGAAGAGATAGAPGPGALVPAQEQYQQQRAAATGGDDRTALRRLAGWFSGSGSGGGSSGNAAGSAAGPGGDPAAAAARSPVLLRRQVFLGGQQKVEFIVTLELGDVQGLLDRTWDADPALLAAAAASAAAAAAPPAGTAGSSGSGAEAAAAYSSGIVAVGGTQAPPLGAPLQAADLNTLLAALGVAAAPATDAAAASGGAAAGLAVAGAAGAGAGAGTWSTEAALLSQHAGALYSRALTALVLPQLPEGVLLASDRREAGGPMACLRVNKVR
jgi:hypothetical protein